MKLFFTKFKITIKKSFVYFLFILAMSASIISIIFNDRQEKMQNELVNKQMFSSSNSMLRSESTLPSVPDYQKNEDLSISPNNLYMLDVFNDFPSRDNLTQENFNKIGDFREALKKFGIPNTDFTKSYTDLLTWIRVFLPDTSLNDGRDSASSAADQAHALYTTPKDMAKKFNSINGLENNSEKLTIYKPENIFNVNGAMGLSPSASEYNVTSEYINDFQYKVAQISLADLQKAETTSLVFDIANEAMPGYANKEYQIIINNNQNDLYSIASDKTRSGHIIQDLVDNSNIIIREKQEIYDPKSTIDEFLDFFTIEFDGNNINIFIKPQNVASSVKPITFGANNQNAKDIAKIGFLDTTISPLYQTNNYLDGKIPVDFMTLDKVNKFKVHKNTIKNVVNDNEPQKVSFWLKDGEEMSFDLFFYYQAQAFANGDNQITLRFENDEIVASDFRKQIKKNYGELSSADLHWEYKNYLFNNVKYSYVTLTADGKVISFNYNEEISKFVDISIPGIGDKKMFWETPGNFELKDGIIGTSGNGSISFNISSETKDIYESYLGYTYANMTGIIDSENEDYKQWTMPMQKDDLILGDQRIYDFNYSFYYANEKGGIEKPLNKNDLLKEEFNINDINISNKKIISHDLINGNYKVDNEGKIILLDSNANNIAVFLNEFYNRYQKWLEYKFEIDTFPKNQNYFWPTSLGFMNSWTIKNILNNSGIGEKVAKNVDVLVRLAYDSYNSTTLTDIDRAFIDSLSNPSNEYYIDLNKLLDNPINNGKDATVKDLLSGTIVTDDHANVDWTNELALQANYIIMVFTEHFLVKAIEGIINGENEIFENVYANLLSSSMKQYLESTNGFTGISDQALKVIDNRYLSNNFKDLGVLTIAGNPAVSVKTGKEQLESLLQFIINFNLQNLYLKAESIDFFNSNNKIVVDPESYSDEAIRSDLNQIIEMLDTIIEGALGKNDYYLLSDIITKLETGQIVNQEAVAYIGQTFNNIINKIASGKKDAYDYEVLNTHATSSYLENIVIGHNLSILYNEWIGLHPELDAQTKLELENLGFYDPSTIAKISIALEYYNVAYFLDSLVNESKIPDTLDSLLKSNLANSITFEIPKTNWFIDATTDTQTVAQYSMIGLGILMSALGSMIVFMAFKKGLVQYLSKNAITSARVASIVVVVLGITLLIIGTIIGPL